MAIDKVREYLADFGIEDKILVMDVSTAIVQLAALALGCEEARIAKSLSFSQRDGVAIVVCAGDARIDNSKYKAYFGEKAKMLSFDEAEALTGHAVGGVCPFALNDGVRVYLDESVRRFSTVYPACGSADSAIELTPDELEKYADKFVAWVDVCKTVGPI